MSILTSKQYDHLSLEVRKALCNYVFNYRTIQENFGLTVEIKISDVSVDERGRINFVVNTSGNSVQSENIYDEKFSKTLYPGEY
tara:strand:- start:206 stop:457 length:252 start_codon:yes stop_codon:yes gene_type:complete